MTTWADVGRILAEYDALDLPNLHPDKLRLLVEMNSASCRAEMAEERPDLRDVYWFARLAAHFASEV